MSKTAITAKTRPSTVFLEYLSRHNSMLVRAVMTSDDAMMVVKMIPAAANVRQYRNMILAPTLNMPAMAP